MIKDENDKYICYAVDDEDWIQEGDEAWDDVTGKKLDPHKVREARKEEIYEYHSHEVYEKRPIKECIDKTGKKPIQVRWIDINKGDSINPEYRSRLVAKEIKQDKR